MAPVLLNGALAYDLRADRIEGEPRRTQHLVTAQINALTFIYAPWLATLGLNVGLTQSRSVTDDDQPPGSDRFITGGVRLNVFPRSRFPFEARYEVADSRTDSSLFGGIDYRSRTLAFTQRYQPESNAFTLSATVERREQDSVPFGSDTQDALLADFSTGWARHRLSAGIARSVNRRHSTDEETDFTSLVARHSYNYGTSLSIENTANWTQSDDRLLVVGPNTVTLRQLSSIALWQPDGMPGLSVAGSLRGFSLQSESTLFDSTTESVAGAVGATYELTRNWRLNASSSVTRIDGSADETLWVNSAGVTWQADTIKLGDYNYDWNASVSGSRASSDQGTENAATTQLGHNLSRVWLTDASSSWALSVGQSASITRSNGALFPVSPGDPEQDRNISRALVHTASLTWSSSGIDRTAYARLSASDARQFDGDHAHFQLLNVQVSGAYEVDRYRGWTGDLTLQRVFQRSMPFEPLPFDPFGPNRVITHSASGELTWRQNRVFGVPRLRYTSRLRLSHDTQRQRAALLALPDRETSSWENRLDYTIGRLEATLSLRIGRVEGLWRELLLVRLQRTFGDY